jgi:HPt (histidine-containing phosphotransfer) domain-containing protein
MTQPFDRAAFLERVEGDVDLLEEILKIFLDQAPVQIAAMQQALAASDAARLQGQAHSLKGAAASISANPLRVAAWQVEMAGRSGNLQHAEALLGVVVQEFDRLKESLQD